MELQYFHKYQNFQMSSDWAENKYAYTSGPQYEYLKVWNPGIKYLWVYNWSNIEKFSLADNPLKGQCFSEIMNCFFLPFFHIFYKIRSIKLLKGIRIGFKYYFILLLNTFLPYFDTLVNLFLFLRFWNEILK